jgi:hypothetical protein
VCAVGVSVPFRTLRFLWCCKSINNAKLETNNAMPRIPNRLQGSHVGDVRRHRKSRLWQWQFQSELSGTTFKKKKKTFVRILLMFSIYVVKGFTRADSRHLQSNFSKAMCVYIQEASESLERERERRIYAGCPGRNFKDERKPSDWWNRFWSRLASSCDEWQLPSGLYFLFIYFFF